MTENMITMNSIYHTGSNGYTDSGNLFDRIQIIHTGSNSGSVNEGFVLTPRSSSIYNRDIFYYSSSLSQSLNLYYSRSLGIASYADDNHIALDNLRYNGSTITGPGVNQNSSYPQLNYKPIIEVYAVNPNQLIFNETPPPNEQGTLLVR